jgi:hypothetical protein
MTQEYKELLLKDLSARLPYGVKVRTPYNDAILRGIVDRKGVKTTIDYTDIVRDKQTYPIRYIKPYIRPMLSMTEEEAEIYTYLWDRQDEFSTDLDIQFKVDLFDWLNKNHFDYRGLIEKGLAIAVTKENNPYKK